MPAPRVFTNIDAKLDALHAKHTRLSPGNEITLLIKNCVIWQRLFAISRCHTPIQQYRCGVVTLAIGFVRVAHHHCDPTHPFGKALKRSFAITVKPVSQQQVFGRVTAQRQLGCQQKVGAGLTRAQGKFKNFRAIAGKIADNAIDLCQGDRHPVCSNR